MIDLHTHTSESDGSYTPAELVDLARELRLDALAITDHDTFAGFEIAKPLADRAKLDLLCGIELSTKYHGKSVHLLGYFPGSGVDSTFRDWVAGLQDSRHERNRLLLEKLHAHGVHISYEELMRRGGPLPGRPHIASLMLEKGYVDSLQQAFDEYLDDSAQCHVQRDEPSFMDAVRRIGDAGGISSLAHPYRLTRNRLTRTAAEIETIVRAMRDMGLTAIEVYHSEHSAEEVSLYANLASNLGLLTTGGSDFHGATKAGIALGTGKSENLRVPVSVIEGLRASFRSVGPDSRS
jgi:predicted metal-dependent phosphoesterase TrpH